MIPTIIHYCWFGKKAKNSSVLKCISTWKLNMPNYEIIEWNESNFDVNSHLFTKEAYANEKYAFVSDYVRLYALYQYGGIYLDTDIEVVKSLSPFLHHSAFAGYEVNDRIGTCVIGAEAQNPFIKLFLEQYRERKFDLSNLETNVSIVGKLLKEHGVILDNSHQYVLNALQLYPVDYFTAKSYHTGKITKTYNTHTIHHFSASWVPWYTNLEKKFWQKLGVGNQHLIYKTTRFFNQLKSKLHKP